MRVQRSLAVLGAAVILAGCLDFSEAHNNCMRSGRCGSDGGAAGGSGSLAGGGEAGGTGSTAGGSMAGGSMAGGSMAGGSMAGGSMAGGSMAGGSTAGGSAGGMAGGGAAGGATAGGQPYDGGPSCSGLRPRLRCDPPLVLGDGGSYKRPALAFMNGGMVYAWANGLRFEVYRATDGGTTKVADELAVTGIARSEVSAEGDTWAAIYHSGENSPIRCFANQGASGVTTGTAGYYGGASVAVSATGEVGVVRGYDVGGRSHLGWAISDAGCPASLFDTRPDVFSDWIGAVWSPTYGFRMTNTGLGNTYSGDCGITAGLVDGGVLSSYALQELEGVGDHSAILSSLDTHALISMSTVHTDGMSDFYVLKIRSLPLDLSTPVDQQYNFPVTDNYVNWDSSPCGPGCMATAVAPELPPGDLTVTFTSDTPIVRAITSSDAGWDVVCNAPIGSTEVSAAWGAGRLHLLVTQLNVARLFSCDVPP